MQFPKWERVFEIVRKEFRVVVRDPRLRIVLIVPPILQSIIFGFAVNMDVEQARIGWHDGDGTPQSRELRMAFEGSGSFLLTHHLQQDAEANLLLNRGDVDAIVRVTPGFGRAILRGDTASVQMLIDGANSNTASIVGEYARRAISGYSHQVQVVQQGQRILARTQGKGPPVTLALPSVNAQSRVWFNENLVSRNYFVPGVVVNIIALVTLMLTALAIVREKEIGTMEQLIVTPIQPLELMLGKTIPFGLVGLFHVTMLTILARALFGVPFRGSLLVLYIASVLFLLTTLGVGLFISTMVRTQQQAMMATFFFFFPVLLLSGFAFPIRSMPEIVQWATYLNPVRYFMEIVRGLFLKGWGVMELWPQLLAMGVLGCTVILASASRFHKRLD
ncbi:MAG: ABC transporter permease [Bryobacterales bacterium]|jgi:ABC-2 type transport system permease protein|nr:ABC transporter permease [Bryobacterales bacterium]